MGVKLSAMGPFFKDLAWFLFSAFRHVWAGVAGSSIAVIGYFYQYRLNEQLPVNVLILGAFTYFLVGCFLTWREEYIRAGNLQEQVRPKLKLSFSQKDSGCFKPGVTITTTDFLGRITSQRQATYVRVKVEIDSLALVKGCIARLLEIKRNDETVFGGNDLTLVFAPAEDPEPDVRDLVDGIPRYIDLLAIGEADNSVKICSKKNAKPSGYDWDHMFDKEGTYKFHVVVASTESNCKSSVIDLHMKWDGKLSTVTISTSS